MHSADQFVSAFNLPVIGTGWPLHGLHPEIDEQAVPNVMHFSYLMPGYNLCLIPRDSYSNLYRYSSDSLEQSPTVEDFRDYDGNADNVCLAVFEGDPFISGEVFTMSFTELHHAKIGVEATSYLQHMMQEVPASEPLLAALGGEPIGLKLHIEKELDNWKANGMTPLFVFEGQSTVGKNDMALRNAKKVLAKTQQAWDIYGDGDPSGAVKAFGGAGAVRGQDLYRILQEVLAERDMDFIIAPFSACAQLAYLDKLDVQYIDGIMGSQELLLYDIHDAIIIPPSADDWEKKSFSGIIKSELTKKLNVTPELLSDALLMIGTSFLPPFPPLQDENLVPRQPYTLVDAINLLRTSEKSITTTCQSFNDILQTRDPNWLDKFRKAKMGIVHCVAVTQDGSVHINDYEHLTEDNVEYLGFQLPPELYHYLSKALIGPRVMNCFNSLEYVVFPTLDGVLSEEYRRLVTRSLVPLKEAAAALVASRMQRYYLVNSIKMRFWFDDGLKTALAASRTIQPQTNQQADTWGVPEAEFMALESTTGTSAGKFSFALLSLQEKSFSQKTISNTAFVDGQLRSQFPRLSSKPEVLSNSLWRLLHLRGYINDQHELTSWGKALATTLKSIGPMVKQYNDAHHLEEAAFLAYELLRFDNLNSRNRHPELTGAPLRGSDEEKANCILIGRTACLLKLRHKSIGYTGPLSKNLLSFYSIVKAVRETDRDLLEAIAVSMFMNNQVTRIRDDYADLGRSLPFSEDINIGLGIAVKTYLDDYMKPEDLDQSSEERRAKKDAYAPDFLPNHINIVEDFDVAFAFFDSLCEGIKILGSEIPEADKKVWDSASTYLSKRR